MESDRPRAVTFNNRVQMRAISMRKLAPAHGQRRRGQTEWLVGTGVRLYGQRGRGGCAISKGWGRLYSYWARGQTEWSVGTGPD